MCLYYTNNVNICQVIYTNYFLSFLSFLIIFSKGSFSGPLVWKNTTKDNFFFLWEFIIFVHACCVKGKISTNNYKLLLFKVEIFLFLWHLVVHEWYGSCLSLGKSGEKSHFCRCFILDNKIIKGGLLWKILFLMRKSLK